jgi:quercetin dioxygenase-like cupin family protein
MTLGRDPAGGDRPVPRPSGADLEGAALLGPDPFEGFDVQVLVDRAVYAPGETVRITVTATNHGARPVEHHHPGGSATT